MVELTFSRIVRRSAAVFRKQHSTTRGSSLSKTYTDVKQRWQLAGSKIPSGKFRYALDEGAAQYIPAPSTHAETTGGIEPASMCKLESRGAEQSCVEELRHHVTHIINNGEDIDALEEGIFRLLPNIEVLYLFDNRLSRIDDLALWTRLRNVYLQNNLIHSMEVVFSNLPLLEEVNLDNNRISRLDGLSGCHRLTRLSIANQQTPLPLTFAADSLHALSKSLRFLDISNNRIEHLRPLATLEGLEFLEAADNNVQTFESVAGVLAGCRQLKCLDLRKNPLNKTPKLRQYLRYILLHASNELCELDGKRVAHVQRTFVRDMHRHQQDFQRQRSKETCASEEVLVAGE